MQILLAEERRYGHPFSLLIVDIDGLGRINDAYGRQAGDQMLTAVSGVVSTQVRTADRAFRLGDDELCVLVGHKGAVESLAVAERLVALIDGSQGLEGPRVTISIGVAACPDHGRTAERLLSGAEEATYAAKAAGDRIGVADDDPALEPVQDR
jgi:diguanylate cyclase (GGDEF)-like protein